MTDLEFDREDRGKMLKCFTGCGSVVYMNRGQCLRHLDPSHVAGHPWTACEVCGRAMDRILGDLATVEDRTCEKCLGTISTGQKS